MKEPWRFKPFYLFFDLLYDEGAGLFRIAFFEKFVAEEIDGLPALMEEVFYARGKDG